MSATREAATPAAADLGADGEPARFAFAIGRLNRLLTPTTRPELSHGVLLALSTIVRQGPLRPSTLGRVEGISAPSVTRLIDDLEKRGLIERVSDPADGRAFFVRATRAGRKAILEARRKRAEHASTMLESLDDSERALLLAALPALEKVAGTSL